MVELFQAMLSTAIHCGVSPTALSSTPVCLLSLLSSHLFSCSCRVSASFVFRLCCVSFACRSMEAARMEDYPALLRERLSIRLLRLSSKCILFLSALSSHPLFSVFAVAALLAALYLPRPLLPLLLSPVPISTLLLLAALFRLGSPPGPEPKHELRAEPVAPRQKVIFCDAYLEWGPRAAPLEVIYEEHEGEADEDVAGRGMPDWPQYPDLDGGRRGLFGFAYADSDTESGSASPGEAGAEVWTSPEEIRLRWEEEEEEEEAEDMIEIELEEENLIEIDITGGR